MQTKIPCVIMRGGTSRGPFLIQDDLPSDPATRDEVLLAIMGSPHEIQVDGIGGSHSVTSKVAMISKSKRPDADIDYFFAQVQIHEKFVDTKPTCGNMLVAVGPFAIDAGLVPAQDGETKVRIHSVNTGALVEAIGAVTGKLLPTGKPRDVIDGVEVSCVDIAMPIVMMRAADMGKTGYESAVELDSDRALMDRMEGIRRKAGVLMGMGDVSKNVVPKIALLAQPRQGGTISSRYFVPETCHKSHPVTGTVCISAACAIPGTLAAEIAPLKPAPQGMVKIEHPSGMILIDLDADFSNGKQELRRAALVRTARRIFEGLVNVPSKIWAGKSAAAKRAA